jgi:hypothetical protein
MTWFMTLRRRREQRVFSLSCRKVGQLGGVPVADFGIVFGEVRYRIVAIGTRQIRLNQEDVKKLPRDLGSCPGVRQWRPEQQQRRIQTDTQKPHGWHVWSPCLIGILAMTAMLFVSPIAGYAQALAATDLSDEQKLVIVHACEDISITYLTFIDTGDFKNMPNVFAEDGVWQVGGNNLVGHKAISEFWQRRVSLRKPEEGWRAAISNQRIDVIDHDHARGTAYITIYKFNRTQANLSLAPFAFTQSNDEYVRTQQGWRLRLRQIVTVAESIEAAQRSASSGKSTVRRQEIQ